MIDEQEKQILVLAARSEAADEVESKQGRDPSWVDEAGNQVVYPVRQAAHVSVPTSFVRPNVH
jgi:hypothetical protein